MGIDQIENQCCGSSQLGRQKDDLLKRDTAPSVGPTVPIRQGRARPFSTRAASGQKVLHHRPRRPQISNNPENLLSSSTYLSPCTIPSPFEMSLSSALKGDSPQQVRSLVSS